MSFTNIKAFSGQGNLVNEDICFVSSTCGWVIDGSSGLTKCKITNGESDAAWYVSEWQGYLKDNIEKDASIEDILKKGVINIRNKYLQFEGASKATALEHPSASILIVRVRDKSLEYFCLGDCTLLYKLKNGKVIKISDDKVSKLDSKVIDEMVKVHNEKNISLISTRPYIDEMLKENRLKKNSVDGYWILGMTEEALQHGLFGHADLEELSKACILSDGFSQYYDTFNLSNDYSEFIDEIGNESLQRLCNELRKNQEQDKDCNKYPRLKVKDDASIVYFEKKSL